MGHNALERLRKMVPLRFLGVAIWISTEEPSGLTWDLLLGKHA